jgi:DNA-binding beta-propeller fold protein YncE
MLAPEKHRTAMTLRPAHVVPVLLSALAAVACDHDKPAVAPSPAPSSAPAPSAIASAPDATPSPAPPTSSASSAPAEQVASFQLPEGHGPVSLDLLAYEPKKNRVWIPIARDAGSVEVFDVATSAFQRVEGLAVVKKEANGKARSMGPSSAAVGDGVVYVGNRGTSEVCIVDASTLKLGSCAKVPVAPDCVVYVASSKEVWATSPHAQSIVVFDASKQGRLTQKQVIKLDGDPEAFAVDDGRGVFYTNFEDKDRTVAIDVKTRAVKATWSPNCGSEGPRGISLDAERNLLAVACTDHVQVLDPKSAGKNLGKLDTGAGVDILDYAPKTRALYVASGKAAKLTVARLGDDGSLTVVETVPTAPGARNAVVDAQGNAYLIDPAGPRLLVVRAPK